MLPGTVVGEYVVEGVLGEGGMGTVYAAVHPVIHKRGAIKVLKPALSVSREAVDRFVQEARAVNQIGHPNIVDIFAFGTLEDGRNYFIMECLVGRTLRERMKERRVPLLDALWMLETITLPLEAAHDKGIVHRDLKPDNVFLVDVKNDRPQLKLLDFGIAKLIHAPGVERTQTGNLLGTPAYISPEQARGELVDHRTDIYALGAMAFELVTGKRVFEANSAADMIAKQLFEAPRAPSTLEPAVPPRLDALIVAMLAKDAAARPTLDKVRAELRACRELSGGILTPPAGLPALPPPRRWRRPLVIAASALAVVAIGLTAWTIGRHEIRTASAATTRRSAAVLGFKNLSARADTAWLSTAIGESLVVDLGVGDGLRTIPGEQVARVRRDLALADADAYGPETLAALRGQLGSELVVVGSYLAMGDGKGESLSVSARVQDTRNGETVAQVTGTATVAELPDVVGRLAAEIRAKLDVGGATANEQRAARAALPARPDAMRLYAQAVSHLHVLELGDAKSLLEQAAQLEPDNAMIPAMQAEVLGLLGYDKQAHDAAKHANDLAAALPSPDRDLIEARFAESEAKWDRAIAIYRSLATRYPDDIEHPLHLAAAQIAAVRGNDALATLELVRKRGVADLRIGLLEARAADALGDNARATEAARRAADAAKAAGARELLAQARLVESRAQYFRGHLEDALGPAREASTIFAAAGDRSGQGNALITLANATEDLGNTAEGEDQMRTAVDVLRQIGDQRNLSRALVGLALVVGNRGDLERAETYHQEALRIARTVGNTRIVGTILNNLADSRRLLGDPDGAMAWIEDGLAARAPDDQPVLEVLTGTRGQIHDLRGEIAAARTDFEQAIELSRKISMEGETADIFDWIAENRIEAGDFEAARKALDEAAQAQTKLAQRSDAARTAALRARLALADDHAADAVAAEAAAADLQRMHELMSATDALLTAIRAHLALHHTDKARAALATLAALPNQGRVHRLTVALATAEVALAAGKANPDAFSKIRDEAGEAHLARLELEARFGLARAQDQLGHREAGSATRAAASKDAEAKGMMRLARLVH